VKQASSVLDYRTSESGVQTRREDETWNARKRDAIQLLEANRDGIYRHVCAPSIFPENHTTHIDNSSARSVFSESAFLSNTAPKPTPATQPS
jgi:hypothetical protein